MFYYVNMHIYYVSYCHRLPQVHIRHEEVGSCALVTGRSFVAAAYHKEKTEEVEQHNE